MAIVKVVHEPGHALCRIHDDYIQPPEIRAQILKELAIQSAEIEYNWMMKQKSLKEQQENGTKEEL